LVESRSLEPRVSSVAGWSITCSQVILQKYSPGVDLGWTSSTRLRYEMRPREIAPTPFFTLPLPGLQLLAHMMFK
jgi:hypothetical protein